MSELPQGWAVARIGEICEASQYGFTAKAQSSGDVHFLRTTDITSGDVDWATVPYCNIQKTDKEKYLLKDGDVVISRAGSVGYSYLLRNPKPSVFASYLIRFRPLISAEYFSYFLKTPAYWEAISEQSLGIAVQNVNATKLAEIEIPIAPASEQARIVEKLEELLSDLDAGVAELKAAQRKLAQYRQSLLKAAVDGTLTADWRAAHGAPQETGAELLQRILTERRARWEQKQLAKYAEKGKAPPKGWQAKYPEPVSPILTDLPPLPEGWTWASIEQVASEEEYALAIGPFGSNLVVSDYRDEGVPLVFVRNIRARTYGGASTKFVSLEKADQLKAHHVSAGDVLVTKMGEPPGDADVYPKGQPTAVITADCIKIRPQCGALNPHYLAAVINSPVGVQQIKPMTKGVAQKKVSLGRFSSFAVPLPPVQEQDTLVALLEAAFSSAREKDDAIEHGLKLARAQRKNLLKAAFAGQLVPQDPNDEPVSELLARIRAAREQSPAPRNRRRTASHPAPATNPPTPTRRGRKAKAGA